MQNKPKHGIFFRVSVFVFSAIIVAFVLRSVEAGSLNPSTSPASTFWTLGNIFNPLASSGYDSSGISADSNGSAIEITKCIITKLHGGSC